MASWHADLDIDSDNSGQLNESVDEEKIETDTSKPGKIIIVNPGSQVTPGSVPPNTDGLVEFKVSTANLAGSDTVSIHYTPGLMNIWKTAPGQVPTAGDLIVPNNAYTAAQLGLDSGAAKSFSIQGIAKIGGLSPITLSATRAGISVDDAVLVNLLPVEVVPDDGMAGVIGDVVKSAKPDSTIKHFVTPKANPPLVGPPEPIDQQYVVLKAVGVTADQITPGHANQIVDWDGGEAVQGEPLKRRVARSAAEKKEVKIKVKQGGAVVAEMHVWVVWATCSSSRTEAQFYQNPPTSARFGSNLAEDATFGIWSFKFKIEPPGICDSANNERPRLDGNKFKDVPGASKPHFLNYVDSHYSPANPAPKADSASKKWDVSRQVEFTIQGPQGITKQQLEEVGCAESFSYPTDSVEGNDDPLAEDEDDNPYQARAIDEFRLGHEIGELTSADAPRMSVLNAWAGTGRTHDEKYNFREFARLELWDGKRTEGKFWFKISADYLWHHQMKASSTGTSAEPWVNSGSSAGIGN